MAIPLPRTGGRRWLTAATLCLVLGLAAWGLVSLGGQDTVRGQVTVATGVSDGVYARYGELLKGYLAHDLPDLGVTLTGSQGSVENLELLTSGRATFTIATADAVALYQRRHRPGAADLRACARLYDDYMQLVVPAGSRVRSAAGLKGLRVGVGTPGSGVQLVSRRLLRAAGLGFGDVRAEQVGIDRMPRMLEDGRLDAFFWSGGLPTSAVTRLAAALPVRLVQLGDLVDRLHGDATNRYYRSAMMPVDAYPRAQRAAVKTVAVANLLVTMRQTDPRLTEAMTRTVMKSRDAIGTEVHAAQKVDLRTAVFTDPLPLHEGARRYYVSVKP